MLPVIFAYLHKILKIIKNGKKNLQFCCINFP